MTKPQRPKWATASVNPSVRRAQRRRTLDTHSKMAQATIGAAAPKSFKVSCAKRPQGKRTAGSNKTVTPSAPSGKSGNQPPQGGGSNGPVTT